MPDHAASSESVFSELSAVSSEPMVVGTFLSGLLLFTCQCHVALLSCAYCSFVPTVLLTFPPTPPPCSGQRQWRTPLSQPPPPPPSPAVYHALGPRPVRLGKRAGCWFKRPESRSRSRRNDHVHSGSDMPLTMAKPDRTPTFTPPPTSPTLTSKRIARPTEHTLCDYPKEAYFPNILSTYFRCF